MVLKNCVVCGKSFNAKGTDKCCSPECSKQRKKQCDKERYEDNYEPVIKTCVVCGKTFNARGSAKCCSPECSKERKKQQNRRYYLDNREAKLQQQREYYAENRDAILEHQKDYRTENKDPRLIHKYKKDIRIVDDLISEYGPDYDLVMQNSPSTWYNREIQTRLWFNESYFEGLISKIESTPVCEVTGKKGNLVIHHLYSFSTHPELGNDLANLVRIDREIHDEFHRIYGKRKNTPDQWCEFVNKYYNGGDN